MKRWLPLAGIVLLAAAWPRFLPSVAAADDPAEAGVIGHARNIYSAMNAEELEVLRQWLWVQRVDFIDVGYLAGSCSGYPQSPKPNKLDDYKVVVHEIGPFGVTLNRINYVCGGRIPLNRDIWVNQELHPFLPPPGPAGTRRD